VERRDCSELWKKFQATGHSHPAKAIIQRRPRHQKIKVETVNFAEKPLESYTQVENNHCLFDWSELMDFSFISQLLFPYEMA
jgi:hypothetical protein